MQRYLKNIWETNVFSIHITLTVAGEQPVSAADTLLTRKCYKPELYLLHRCCHYKVLLAFVSPFFRCCIEIVCMSDSAMVQQSFIINLHSNELFIFVFLITIYLKPYSIGNDQYGLNPTICPKLQYQVLYFTYHFSIFLPVQTRA